MTPKQPDGPDLQLAPVPADDRQGRARAARSSAAVVAGAAVLLAIGSAGGAVAGQLITGKQIKNNTITTADIKDKTVTRKDLAKSARPRDGVTGPAGPAGHDGAPGDRGPAGPPGSPGTRGERGQSAWETIPSGQTITGYMYPWHTSNEGAPNLRVWFERFPGKAPRDLSFGDVNFAPTANGTVGDADPECTGTASDPTAPAGKVCIYLAPSPVNAKNFEGTLAFGAPKDGFIVEWQPVSPDGRAVTTAFSATWAYTAP